MSTHTEWAAFRKERPDETPMENRTFTSRESAEKYIGYFIKGPSWLEVHSREVTDWKAS
jgi:hypothetical protein